MKLSNPEHINIYNTLWWKALWKIIIKELSDVIEWLASPNFQIIKVEDLLSWNFINTMEGKRVVFKFSWLEDDFSNFSSRWKNSSWMTPRMIIEKDVKKQILDILWYKKISNYNSIILEEFITTKNPFEYTVHIDWKEILLEMWHNNIRTIVVGDMDRNIRYLQSTVGNENINKNDIEKILGIHLQIYHQLWFDINTEWFYDDDLFKAVQIRNIPNDYIVDERLSKKIQNIWKNPDYYSRFVNGVFDMSWKVVTVDELNNIWSETVIVMIENEETTWDIDILKDRLKSWFDTVILDSKRWFHLSHRPEYLPNTEEIRKNFNYISISWIDLNNLYWKFISIVSDWRQWLIFENNK